VRARNRLGWDAENAAGLVRGQLFDAQAELAQVITQVQRVHEDERLLVNEQAQDVQHLQRRVHELDTDRQGVSLTYAHVCWVAHAGVC